MHTPQRSVQTMRNSLPRNVRQPWTILCFALINGLLGKLCIALRRSPSSGSKYVSMQMDPYPKFFKCTFTRQITLVFLSKCRFALDCIIATINYNRTSLFQMADILLQMFYKQVFVKQIKQTN